MYFIFKDLICKVDFNSRMKEFFVKLFYFQNKNISCVIKFKIELLLTLAVNTSLFFFLEWW